MRIRELLAGLPADDRTAIVRHHRVAADIDIDDLARHLVQSRTLLNTLRGELKPVTDLVERLAALGGEAPVDAVADGVSPHRLRGAQTKGLVWLLPSPDAPERVVLPLEYRLMREVRRPTIRDLTGGLRTLSVDQARRVAEQLGIAVRRNLPLLLADLHDALVARAETIARDLDADARTVLDGVLASGGATDAGAHHRQYPLVAETSARGPFHVADLFGTGRFRGKATPTQRLVQHALLFPATERDQPSGVVDGLFVAQELIEPLQSLHGGRRQAERDRIVDAHAVDVDEPTDPAPADVRDDLRAFVLGAAARGYRLARAGRARRDDAAAVRAWRPSLTDDAQEALAELAVRLGALRDDDGVLHATDDAPARLDAPGDAFAAAVRDAATREAGEADPIPPRIRAAVLNALGRVPDRWLSIDGVAALVADEPDVRRLVAVHDVDPATLRDRIETALGPLNHWGFVDCTREPVPACRFRGLAIDDLPELPARCVTIPPNLDVMAPMIAPLDVLLTLGDVCEPVRYDRAAMFRLTPTSLLRAADRGIAPADVATRLAAHCAHPLPDEVARLVDDAVARDGEVRIRRTSALVLVSEPTLVEALRRHPVLADARAVEVAPGVYALPDGCDVRAVHAALRDAGVHAAFADADAGA